MSSTFSRSRVTLGWVLASFLMAQSTWAAGAASFGGRVFEADGRTPRTGAVVALVDAQGQPMHQAAPTGNDGAFHIEGASAGSYRLLVETPAGAFLAANAVALDAGANPPVALSLRANYQEQHGLGKSGELSRWTRWLIAGGIGVAALLVILDVSDAEDTASDF